MTAGGQSEAGLPPELHPVSPSGSSGALLRHARLEAGQTLQQLAQAVACSVSQLSQMETGQRRLTADRARDLERALGITDGRLVDAVHWEAVPPELIDRMRNAEESRSRTPQPSLLQDLRSALESQQPLAALRSLVERAAERGNIEPAPAPPRRIPLINRVAAGYPAEFTDLGYPASIADEYVACTDLDDPDAFAARVVGDSMQPDYKEGEIVVFSPALPTPPGSDCFVRLERDAESTFKRIEFEEDGEVIVLKPLNPDYPARRVRREEVAAMYAAAYVMRRVKRHEAEMSR